MEINFLLGKNGGQMPSILGCRSIVIGRQAGGQAGRQTKSLQFTKVLKFENFNSKVCLGCLNEFMMPIASY